MSLQPISVLWGRLKKQQWCHFILVHDKDRCGTFRPGISRLHPFPDTGTWLGIKVLGPKLIFRPLCNKCMLNKMFGGETVFRKWEKTVLGGLTNLVCQITLLLCSQVQTTVLSLTYFDTKIYLKLSESLKSWQTLLFICVRVFVCVCTCVLVRAVR